MTAFKPVVVVGLGGIGSHLVEPLARYLAAQPPPLLSLVLVDGDAYVSANAGRQRVHANEMGMNKAEAHAARLELLFPGLTVTAKPSFVDERNARGLVSEGSCVLACVDNHATRKVLTDAVARLQNGLLISGGNDVTDGNVQVYWRASGRNRTAPLDRHHPEILHPRDVNPSHLTCEQLAAQPPTRQILMANLTAAALMLNAYHTILADGSIPYGEVYFDILMNRANSRRRP